MHRYEIGWVIVRMLRFSTVIKVMNVKITEKDRLIARVIITFPWAKPECSEELFAVREFHGRRL